MREYPICRSRRAAPVWRGISGGRGHINDGSHRCTSYRRAAEMDQRLSRVVGLLLVWWLPIAVVLGALTWWPELPADIPTKWDGTGPTQFTPLWLLTAGVVLAAVVAAGFATVSVCRQSGVRSVWIPAGLAAMCCGAWFFIAFSSLGVDRVASGPTPWALTTPLLMLYGFIPARVAAGLRPRAFTACEPRTRRAWVDRCPGSSSGIQ